MTVPGRTNPRSGVRSGFSLVELVIVIVIIGILAAIAIPRFTRASGNAGEATLQANLKMLRDAIEEYTSEHNGVLPAYKPAGPDAGHSSSEAFERQLCWFTTDTGNATQTADGTHFLGPYLRKLPSLTVGANAGKSKVVSMNSLLSTPGNSGPDYGWEYCHYTGDIRPNCRVTEVGSNGVPYCEW